MIGRYARATLFTFILLPGSSLMAQMVFNNDNGTSNSTFLLSNSLAVHTQSLYLPSDLQTNLTGDIVQLYYRYGSTGQTTGNTLGDLKIRIGQTTATAFVSNNIYFTGLDMVLHEQTYEIPPGNTGEWLAIPLTNYINFDPSQTLIIDIMFGSTAVGNLGFLGTSNNGRKLRSADTLSTTGLTTSTTWQDMGFDISTTTGIEHVSIPVTSVRPNPFSNNFQVITGGILGTDARVEVLDMTGRSIITRNIASDKDMIELDLNAHPPGIYFVRLTDEEGTNITKKVIKQ